MGSTLERPLALRAAAWILAVEACALVGGGAVAVSRAIEGSAAADAAVAIAVLAVAMGGVLGAGAWALLRGRTWPRGIALTWQLLQIAAGAALLDSSVLGGVSAIVLAAAATVAIVLDVRARPSQ